MRSFGKLNCVVVLLLFRYCQYRLYEWHNNTHVYIENFYQLDVKNHLMISNCNLVRGMSQPLSNINYEISIHSTLILFIVDFFLSIYCVVTVLEQLKMGALY